MLVTEDGPSVVVVEHVGGEGLLELNAVGVLLHALAGLLLLFLLGRGLGGGRTRARSGSGNALFVLLGGLCAAADGRRLRVV